MKTIHAITALLLLITLGIYSCTPKQDQNQSQGPKTVSGWVLDASMNNIMIVSHSGDTLNISVMDADPTNVPGVLINDSVEITYSIEKGTETSDILKAIKLVITHHSPYFYIAGTWVQPNPIKPQEMQGFILNQDGTASSVNMATLIFKNWILKDATLLLTSESIGNRQTIKSTDTLKIVKLDADSLILSRSNEILWRLARQK